MMLTHPVPKRPRCSARSLFDSLRKESIDGLCGEKRKSVADIQLVVMRALKQVNPQSLL